MGFSPLIVTSFLYGGFITKNQKSTNTEHSHLYGSFLFCVGK